MEKKASIVNERIKIEFSFNPEDLNNIRAIPGRKFHSDKDGKYWSCPVTKDGAKALYLWGFRLDKPLQELIGQNNNHSISSQPKKLISKIPGLKGTLLPFQKLGVSFIEERNGRALVGDDMGLGKTIQALAWLQLHPELRPVVIVVPASLKHNWRKEIHNWMTEQKSKILRGSNPANPRTNADILIINYDILTGWVDELRKVKPKALILDEIHYIKTNEALRTKAIKKLAKEIPYIVELSGTPLLNRPIELYNGLKLIDDGTLPNYWTYVYRFCAPKWNGRYGWNVNGASNTDELHELVKRFIIRRKKQDVLPELPDKTYSFVPMELNNAAEYERVEKEFIKQAREQRDDRASRNKAFTQIEVLKQITTKGKLPHMIQWIKDFLEIKDKLVVFATHTATINTLVNEFKDISVKIDGSVPLLQRQKAVDDFQTNPNIRLLVGMIDKEGKPAGVGITLTASSSVAFAELQWSPYILDQAADRCHRIGQKDNVTVYYLLALGTIEERIASIIDRKRKILNEILDGKRIESESLLSELINQMKEGRTQ